MSELEKRIQALPLRAPEDSLDERILATIRQADCLPSTEVSGPEKSGASETVGFSSSRNSHRRGTVVTSGWIVASVSVLIGTVVGNALPSLSELHVNRDAAVDANHMTGMAASAHPELVNGSSETAGMGQMKGSPDGNITGSSRSTGSQIVESIWISPTAAAVAWEQQTGQIFNVVNHVSDRRFDMCRECHRVGG